MEIYGRSTQTNYADTDKRSLRQGALNSRAPDRGWTLSGVLRPYERDLSVDHGVGAIRAVRRVATRLSFAVAAALDVVPDSASWSSGRLSRCAERGVPGRYYVRWSKVPRATCESYGPVSRL